MNTTESKEYIEPTGFDGTKGEWELGEHHAGFMFWNIESYVGNNKVMPIASIYNLGTGTEEKANAILLSQSKEMLKLLQYISKATNSPTIGIKCDEMIKKALNTKK